MQIPAITKFTESGFQDLRLFQRANLVIDKMLANPNASISQTFNDTHQQKAYYRLINNSKINYKNLVLNYAETLATEIIGCGETVLAIQDTTDLNYTNLKKTKLGHITTSKNTFGIKVHTTIASTTSGIPLGVLAQKSWSRVKHKTEYKSENDSKKRKIEDKESYIWIESLLELQTLGIPKFILIGDRESDIYEYLTQQLEKDQHILVRSKSNRSTIDGLLWSSELTTETDTIEVKNQNVPCQISFGKVLIKKPSNLKNDQASDQANSDFIPKAKELFLVKINSLDTTENTEKNQTVDTTKKVSDKNENISKTNLESKTKLEVELKIDWKLLTTMPVTSLEEAKKIIQYYKHRWLIEEFHFNLKSGCNIEKAQLGTEKALLNNLAFMNLKAIKILNLKYFCRYQNPPAKEIISTIDLKILQIYYAITPKKINQITAQEVVVLIAKLGGFRARKSDGSPGSKSIWQGLSALTQMRSFYTQLGDVGKG